jgi:hypothetical protein
MCITGDFSRLIRGRLAIFEYVEHTETIDNPCVLTFWADARRVKSDVLMFDRYLRVGSWWRSVALNPCVLAFGQPLCEAVKSRVYVEDCASACRIDAAL